MDTDGVRVFAVLSADAERVDLLGFGVMTVDGEGREVARVCPGCASRRLVRQFGGEAQTWGSWEERAELAVQVALLRAWRGVTEDGRGWSCLLHAVGETPNFGTGKSHAVQATGHEWAARNVRVRYVDVPSYLERLREAMRSDDPPTPVEGYPGLLILDDLGGGNVTEWVEDVIERVSGWRYRFNLPTLIASNKNLSALEEDFPRMVDRLHQGLLLEWSATSWRRR